MKKLLQILSAGVVGASLVVGVAAAGAYTNECSIIYQQKDSASYKSCESNPNNSVRVTCVNDVYVIDNTSQQAGTGNATITPGSNGGYAVSGNAENESNSTVTIGASCGQPATTPVTQPTTPTSVGKGAGTPAAVTATPATPAAQTPAAASLPETGSNTVVNDAVIGTIVLAGTLALAQAGTFVYRRLALK